MLQGRLPCDDANIPVMVFSSVMKKGTRTWQLYRIAEPGYVGSAMPPALMEYERAFIVKVVCRRTRIGVTLPSCSVGLVGTVPYAWLFFFVGVQNCASTVSTTEFLHECGMNHKGTRLYPYVMSRILLTRLWVWEWLASKGATKTVSEDDCTFSTSILLIYVNPYSQWVVNHMYTIPHTDFYLFCCPAAISHLVNQASGFGAFPLSLNIFTWILQ